MQITPFILLLGSLLLPITLDAYAIPLTREQTGVVTLPLKRAPMRRDLHPQMLFRMHNVRSHQRLARMTGREVPSAEVLLDRLAVREASITRRGSARVGYPGGKLANNNLPNVVTTGEIAHVDIPVLAADASGKGFSPVSAQAVANNSLTPANTPSNANSLGLDIEGNDVGYIATVQMGTPPRDFKLLMDSGSADLWVGAEQCISVNASDCGNHVFLGQQSSSSFVDTQTPFQITYGSGAVAGNVITDNLVVAGLQISGHTFGVATEESQDFSSSQTNFDGIMGLAQSILSQQQTLTPVESLAKAGLIQEAIVSFKLSRLADQKNDGEITFGGLDASKFDANTLVTINNVNAQGFWEGGIDSVSLNGTDLGLTGRTAILDTGTTLLIVPPGDAQAIHQAIPGAVDLANGTFTIPCTTQASLALTFRGRSFAIDPRDIAFAPVDLNNLTGDCVSGITAGQIGGGNQWLAGDVFLKNVYFSTNVGKNTMQLAKLT
ncbi:acid protease [Russula earlei]|uniref:Acid protease n=1 Tax=Russula earlei TaxID=71964 RepID=A0ACC0UN42_9AGAM|nr:acid protease [Russula earlei]